MAKKTIKIRIKDSTTAKHLKQMAKAVNFVWNFCNETDFNALRNHNQWLSAGNLEKLTKGSSKEIGLNSTTI